MPVGIHDGRKKHPLYQTWGAMIQRCTNPNATGYDNYGGRGIEICNRWREDFWSFVEDMGDRPEGHTLDRIDNNQGYSPDNCRWASLHKQASNNRLTGNAKGYYKNSDGKYQAHVYHQGKQKFLGKFDCPLMAHLAYRDARMELKGY